MTRTKQVRPKQMKCDPKNKSMLSALSSKENKGRKDLNSSGEDSDRESHGMKKDSEVVDNQSPLIDDCVNKVDDGCAEDVVIPKRKTLVNELESSLNKLSKPRDIEKRLVPIDSSKMNTFAQKEKDPLQRHGPGNKFKSRLLEKHNEKAAISKRSRSRSPINSPKDASSIASETQESPVQISAPLEIIKNENYLSNELPSSLKVNNNSHSSPPLNRRSITPEYKVGMDQPLDLSLKSSKVMHTPKTQKEKMSPALISLQQKFGGTGNYFHSQRATQAKSHFSYTVPPYQSSASAVFPYPRQQYTSLWYQKHYGFGGNAIVSTLSGSTNPKPSHTIPSPISSSAPSWTTRTVHKPSVSGNLQSPTNFVAATGSKLLPLEYSKSNCIDYKCDCGKTFNTLYELSIHMQETGHMPKYAKSGPSGDYPKLVRGQDMWLNSGSEQTKQILRCMQCGESFKTLPELTVHMMKTQHYADIFSSAHRKLHKCTTFFEKENDTKSVFKCRVCDTEYDTLDALANHMVESKHHKKQHWRLQYYGDLNSKKLSNPHKVHDPKLPSIEKDEVISPEGDTNFGPSMKKRKIDIQDILSDCSSDFDSEPPVLSPILDIEPSETKSKENYSLPPKPSSPNRESPDVDRERLPPKKAAVNDYCKIQCENCRERINTEEFVEHVRHCINKSIDTGSKDNVTDKDSKEAASDNSVAKQEPISNKLQNEIEIKSEPFPAELPLKSDSESGVQGSALQAMEHLIESFNQKNFCNDRIEKSRTRFKYSMTFNSQANAECYVSSNERSSVRNNLLGDDKNDGYQSHGVDKNLASSPTSKESYKKFLYTSDENNKSSNTNALENLFKFATMDPNSEIQSPERRSPSQNGHCSSPHWKKTAIGKTKNTSNNSDHESETSENNDTDNKLSQKDSKSDLSNIKMENDSELRKVKYHLSKKYLNPSSPIQEESTPDSSSLKSLKGLIDNHLSKKEHPLDSLQKLINETDKVPSQIPLHIRLTGDVPNPYLCSYMMPLNAMMPPSIGTDRVDIPLNNGTDSKISHSDASTDGEDEREINCELCNKTFSRKNGWKAHRDKCEFLQKPKKDTNKTGTSYTYMPLVYTNKFSKYYEMAKELANKTK